MGTILKLTLATGETQEIPFTVNSTITVKSQVQRDPGAPLVNDERTFTNVTDATVETVADTAGAPQIVGDPTLDTPATALEHAANLALADAGAHIEKALTKFPGDEDLLQAQAELDAQIRAIGQPATTAAPAAGLTIENGFVVPPTEEPAPATVVEPAPVEPVADPTVTDATVTDVTATDPATLETPQAAADHAVTLPLDEAEAHVEAALAKFPGDPDLVAIQTEIADAKAAQAPAAE